MNNPLEHPPFLDQPLGIQHHNWEEATLPKVSIVCTTYNHERYIAQAIEGFLSQQTTFPVEIIIHDDASTDGTVEILKEYKLRHPNLFILILQKENQYSKVKAISSKFIYPRTRGTYIAICEGDDYWTDPLKLQKQVSFLEAHPDYGLCSHRTQKKNKSNPAENTIFPDIRDQRDYTIEEFIQSNHIATNSIVFNKHYYKSFDWQSKSPVGDWVVILILLKNSNQRLRVLHDVMSVYRVHSQGVHSGLIAQYNKGKAYELHLTFIKVIEKYLFKDLYRKEVLDKKIDTILRILRYSGSTLKWYKELLYRVLIKYYRAQRNFV